MKKRLTGMILAACVLASMSTPYNTFAEELTEESSETAEELTEESQGTADELTAENQGTAGELAAENPEITEELTGYIRDFAGVINDAKEEVQGMLAGVELSDDDSADSAGGDIWSEANELSERQEIVDFALQFVGNPYVWGGTSLTGGADCSGFVLSVFSEFGYSLPRVAADQYNASTKKDISALEPGDLVFYGSGITHVALYIGDGQIVHAANSRLGIIVSDITWMNPVAGGTYLS